MSTPRPPKKQPQPPPKVEDPFAYDLDPTLAPEPAVAPAKPVVPKPAPPKQATAKPAAPPVKLVPSPDPNLAFDVDTYEIQNQQPAARPPQTTNRQPPTTAPLLTVTDLEVCYGPIAALHGISLQVHRGEIVTLIGSNGAGKTTLLRTISGLLRPTRGSIQLHRSGAPADAPQRAPQAGRLNEERSGSEPVAVEYYNPVAADPVLLSSLAPHAIVRLGVSHVPEGRQTFAHLSVLENLKLGAYPHDAPAQVREDLDRAYQMFPVLAERRNQRAGTLSGGEQQMLAIARALMARPQVLLLDEPSLGLAPLIVRKIFQIIRQINAEQGTTIFLVEQNAHMALTVAHRGYVLQTGTILLADAAANLLQHPDVKKAYLGG